MTFYSTLAERTAEGRRHLLGAPIIVRCFSGDITQDDYVSFLLQAYHHVKHTVPLLMGVGARLPESREWLRAAVAEYIAEEAGHQEWVLDDIAACGYDKEAARRSQPHVSTELMVAYAWDLVNRVNPLGFFGMVHVLEGTSVSIASQAADAIKARLGLPQQAFSYLYSHGALDQDHLKFFEGLMNRITDPAEQELIVHSASVFYQLYGNIFRALDGAHGLPRLSVGEPVHAN
ncbi:MAG: iron-containing redox enzyme family protein [Burkholderiaceae bacterium]|jgi:pyrroloquinoline quinone (PQQ) biosynthesis protein C|nr:iron-containing redox enzyme family protein [Burkholderiaceae bacterium]